MSKRRPYFATISNIIFPGIIFVSNLARRLQLNPDGPIDLTFDTAPTAQNSFSMVAIVYTAVIALLAIFGLFRLEPAKYAARMAIPVYFIIFAGSMFVGLIYSGNELQSLNTNFRIMFVIIGIIALWLIWACMRTIRYNASPPIQPTQKGKLSGNDYWKSPR